MALEQLKGLWQNVQQRIPPQVYEHLGAASPWLQDPRVQWTAGVVLAPLALTAFNRTLSHLALNWNSPGKWDPSKELVLITGGSSGIGMHIVKDLAENHHVRIVILDVADPSYELRTWFFFFFFFDQGKYITDTQ